MKNLWDSIVRSIVPLIVGAVIAFFVARGVELDAGVESALSEALVALFGGVWYVAARLLEVYVSPKFGWLLGLAKQPEYDATVGQV